MNGNVSTKTKTMTKNTADCIFDYDSSKSLQIHKLSDM